MAEGRYANAHSIGLMTFCPAQGSVLTIYNDLMPWTLPHTNCSMPCAQEDWKNIILYSICYTLLLLPYYVGFMLTDSNHLSESFVWISQRVHDGQPPDAVQISPAVVAQFMYDATTARHGHAHKYMQSGMCCFIFFYIFLHHITLDHPSQTF